MICLVSGIETRALLRQLLRRTGPQITVGWEKIIVIHGANLCAQREAVLMRLGIPLKGEISGVFIDKHE
jgi:hypothetical protein